MINKSNVEKFLNGVKNVHLVSHNDLDGYASQAILARVFKDYNLTFYNTHYGRLPQIANNLKREITDNESVVVISDICFSEENLRDLGEKVFVLDHHISSIYAQDIATYCIMDTKKSATMICYDFAKDIMGVDINEDLAVFTNDYDLWFHKHPESKVLNRWMGMYKSVKATDRFGELLRLYTAQKHDTDILTFLKSNSTHDMIDENVFNYFEYQENEYVKKIVKGCKTGILHLKDEQVFLNVCFANSYASEIADKILVENPDNIVMVINMENQSGSLRASDDKFQCNKIAEKFEGGGHACASGFRISDIAEFFGDYLQIFYNK